MDFVLLFQVFGRTRLITAQPCAGFDIAEERTRLGSPVAGIVSLRHNNSLDLRHKLKHDLC